MRTLRSILSFLVSSVFAYSASFVADMLFGRMFGIFPATVWPPIITWSVLASLSIFGAHKLSRNKWLIVSPIFLFGVLALWSAIVSSHPHSYQVAAVLFLIGFLFWRVPLLRSGSDNSSEAKGRPMKSFGNLFKIVAGIIFAITGIWGFFLCLAIIVKVAGFWGLAASLVLTPITFVAAPLYAGFAWGNWFPLFLTYGGGLVAAIFFGIGLTINRD